MNRIEDLEKLISEQRNVKTVDIDRLSMEEILRVINEEDKKVAYAVEREIPNIAKAAHAYLRSLKNGGRVFYVGAGTSGRMGVIDRAELISTFKMDPKAIIPILAGGVKAMYGPSEMAEDKEENGRRVISKYRVDERDSVIGISASGRTPYVVGALKEAKRRGATTIAITVNPDAEISRYADIVICPLVGPEVIAGSTRMKAGTAQKMILTMLSTAVMVKLGRVYSNLMVSLLPISSKLRERARRIVMTEAGVDYETAAKTLEETGYDIKAAIIMLKAKVDYGKALKALREAEGNLEKALNLALNSSSSSKPRRG
ncbi:MAG: N-acetylmuramic acid 6-phosphate etherase [Candidatus Bathyarchaeota archaeon B24]|nr:MAG: N-acetylmuramic acid 6-phosphate etherase [Candidatus Bathyarchaeota archaeon B24]MCD6444703.1 N-acetylmuramic acid 6-phosphate etherase [Candidatus Bathyarchaeota archaeon]